MQKKKKKKKKKKELHINNAHKYRTHNFLISIIPVPFNLSATDTQNSTHRKCITLDTKYSGKGGATWGWEWEGGGGLCHAHYIEKYTGCQKGHTGRIW